jgi:hypothetical protein
MNRELSAIDALTIEIEAGKDVVKRAQARLDGKDKEWWGRMWKLLDEVCGAVKGYKPGDDAVKAVYLVAQVQAAARELHQPMLLVRHQESLLAHRKQLLEEQERIAALRQQGAGYTNRAPGPAWLGEMQ